MAWAEANILITYTYLIARNRGKAMEEINNGRSGSLQRSPPRPYDPIYFTILMSGCL